MAPAQDYNYPRTLQLLQLEACAVRRWLEPHQGPDYAHPLLGHAASRPHALALMAR